MYCPKCGSNVPENCAACPTCGAAVPVRPQVKAEPAVSADEAEITAKRIRDNAKICAILWIVVGAFQCLTCAGAICGVWNIVMGVRGLSFAKTIVPGNRQVYERYDSSMTMIVITAVINFLLGLIVGCGVSVFEFIIRDQVIKNKKVFGA